MVVVDVQTIYLPLRSLESPTLTIPRLLSCRVEATREQKRVFSVVSISPDDHCAPLSQVKPFTAFVA